MPRDRNYQTEVQRNVAKAEELTTLGTTRMAEMLDMSPPYLNRLSNNGTLPKLGPGRYDPFAVVAAYVRYLKAGLDTPSLGNGNSRESYAEQRTRLYKTRADAAEFEFSQMRGDIISFENAIIYWGDLITTAKMRLLSIPKKLSAQVALINSPAKIETLLAGEINQALTELATANALPPTDNLPDVPHVNGGDAAPAFEGDQDA